MESPSSVPSLNLIQRISAMFKVIIPPPPPVTSERERVSSAVMGLVELKPDRLSMYKDYEEMDTEIVELSSALDIYADFVVSAPTAEVYNVEFVGQGLELEGDIAEEFEDRVDLKERVWSFARNLCKKGDLFIENICSDWCVEKLKMLPAEEMFLNMDNKGKLDENKPYYQFDAALGRKIAEFEPWEISHFKIGEGDYGVKESILWKLRRTYRVLRMLEDTVLVTRVTRSHMRNVYYIDVTGMGEKEAAEYIRKIKLLNKRKLYFTSDGKLKTEIDPLASQEDIYVPVRKGGQPGNFQTIGGDPNIGEIRDVEHFHNKMFTGTKVPKAYLGFEGDVNSKATLYQQHIAFVKVVRRFRYALAMGLKKSYRVEFMLNGVNPNDFTWRIVFPNIGSPDEEAAWSIENLKASVIQAYGSIGIKLPIEWVVRKLMMNLTSDEADYLINAMKNPDMYPTIKTQRQTSPFMSPLAPIDPKDLSKGFLPMNQLGLAGVQAQQPPAGPKKITGPVFPVATPPAAPEYGDARKRSLGLIMKDRQVFNDTALEDLAKKMEEDPAFRKAVENIEREFMAGRKGEPTSSYKF